MAKRATKSTGPGPGERKTPRVLVRLTAADGVEWTIHDVTWSKGKHHRRPLGDPTATERVFLNADGVKRAYKFKPSDTRLLEEQALERQLGAAAFMPTEKPDAEAPSLGASERRTPMFDDGSAPAPSPDDKGLHGLSDAPGG